MGFFNALVNEAVTNVSGEQNGEFDSKKSKVESMIREINNIHDRYICQSQLLRLIFDYEKLNEYGKIIVKEAGFKLATGDTSKLYEGLFGTDNEVALMREAVTKIWIDCCRKKVGLSDNSDAFYFILYALLVVSVDNTDKEKHLSIICDFARMLMITDEEVRDILEMIKILYDRSDSEVLSQHCHQETYGTKAYDELLERKCKEFDKYIKSNRTLRMFEGFFEKYVGIKEEDVLYYREYGYIKKTCLWA